MTFKRLNITLDSDVLARADAFATRERFTRSGLIAAALDAYTHAAAPGGGSIAREPGATYARVVAVPPAHLDASAHPRSPALAQIVPLLRAFLAARDDIEAAWIFGSAARDEAGPRSDVDITVLPADPLDRDAAWRLREDLATRLPGVLGVRDVDVAVLPDVGVALGFAIASEGVLVWGQESRAAEEFVISALTSYWEMEEVRQTARAALGERMREYGAGQ